MWSTPPNAAQFPWFRRDSADHQDILGTALPNPAGHTESILRSVSSVPYISLKMQNKNKHKPAGLLLTALALTFDEWPGFRRITTHSQPLIRLIAFLFLPEHCPAVPSGMLQYYLELGLESCVIEKQFPRQYTRVRPKAQ